MLNHSSLVRLSSPVEGSPPDSSVHGKNTGVGCHALPSPGDLFDPGIELAAPAFLADSLPPSHW